MREYKEASKPGSVRAPKGFVAMLRKVTGDPLLNCWWDPEAITYAQHPRSNPGMPGCWVIWHLVRVRQNVPRDDGIQISFEHRVWVNIWNLDGSNDNPMHLGRWVAEALNASNLAKRGNSRRRRDLDDARERAWVQADKESTAFAFDFSRDKFVKGVFQRGADARGDGRMDRADTLALERKLWEKNARQHERMLATAKSMRLLT